MMLSLRVSSETATPMVAIFEQKYDTKHVHLSSTMTILFNPAFVVACKYFFFSLRGSDIVESSARQYLRLLRFRSFKQHMSGLV